MHRSPTPCPRPCRVSPPDAAGPPPLVVGLIGPTGSGKSAAAMAAALGVDVPVEVVAVDAFTVYRGMDIGTATPSVQDRALVPHHMVDRLDPEQECTIGWFQPAARAAIAGVHARGAMPLLVGGSGLYWRAVVDPLEMPPTDPDVRAAVEARWAADPPAGHAHLATLDPAAASRIEPDNLRRTVRALEVIELTGRRFSDFRTTWEDHEAIYPGLQVVGVEVDRPTLGERIAARTHAMLAAGWLEEARTLIDRDLSASAAQAIGYAELFAVLRGERDLADATEAIITRTRRFATRQQRWFARDPRVRWTPPEQAAAAVTALLRSQG